MKPSGAKKCNLFLKQLMSCVLCVCLLCSMAACQDPVTNPTNNTTDPAGTTVATQPPQTNPTVTHPTETEPTVTEPTETEPTVTEPTETEPTVTEPAETEPTVTEPVETEPAETLPSEPQPDDSIAEPLVGTWLSVRRYDYEEGDCNLYLLYIAFHADGTGEISDAIWTNMDFESNCLTDQWIIHGGYASTSEYFTYTVDGDKLAITFQGHEFLEYDPFTVTYTVTQSEENFITLADPVGNPEDSAFGAEIEQYGTYYKNDSGKTLEELCAVFGVDYSLPPVKDQNGTLTTDMLFGLWENAARDENGAGEPYLSTGSVCFNDDGTGWFGGCEYVAWDFENGCPSDHWEVAPMGYPATYFTYVLEGDQLAITYTGEDTWEGEFTPFTEIYTVSLDASGFITMVIMRDDYSYTKTYLKTNNTLSLEELCAAFGVDYSIPSTGSGENNTDSAEMLISEWWGLRLTEEFIDMQIYDFREDGTGTLSFMAYGHSSDGGWYSMGDGGGYYRFNYVLEGDQLSLTFTHQIDGSGPMEGIDQEIEPYTEVYTVSSIDDKYLVINDEFSTYLRNDGTYGPLYELNFDAVFEALGISDGT